MVYSAKAINYISHIKYKVFILLKCLACIVTECFLTGFPELHPEYQGLASAVVCFLFFCCYNSVLCSLSSDSDPLYSCLNGFRLGPSHLPSSQIKHHHPHSQCYSMDCCQVRPFNGGTP